MTNRRMQSWRWRDWSQQALLWLVSKEEAGRRFGSGTVSRLALIVKDKPDGKPKEAV